MTSDTEITPLLQQNKPPPPPSTLKKSPGLSQVSSVFYILCVFGVPPIVALPAALEYCGLVGFLIVPGLLFVTSYTALILARSWILFEEKWPHEAATRSKHPYAALSNRVGGPMLRTTTCIILNVAILGEAVPFLLLASSNFASVLNGVTDASVSFSFCYVLIVTAFVLIPILWIGTPKDLGHMIWIGAASVALMVVLVMILLLISAPPNPPPAPLWPRNWNQVAYAFGSVAFQFDIHPGILTLQVDMKDKKKLPSVILVALAVSLLLYGTLATTAFFLYGDSIKTNLLNNFQGSPLLYVTQGVISVQSLICLSLGINTLFQDLEETFGIPDFFGWRRMVLRTTLVLVVLFVAESIPHFGVALGLVGGLLMAPIIFFFPPLIHIVIQYQAFGKVKKKEVVFAFVVLLIGCVGSLSATIESGIQIMNLKNFAPPCYIDTNTVAPTFEEI